MDNRMQKYKLLKDTPFAKAGEELYVVHNEETGHFWLYKDIEGISVGYLHEDYIENFSEWFEEIVGRFYYVDEKGIIPTVLEDYRQTDIHLRQEIGNYFETKEEAEKYLGYLKAKVIIKNDTKGFKPNWNNYDEVKYYGYWDFYKNKLDYDWGYETKRVEIFFKTIEDVKESFEKHPKEWETYLTYEQ